MIFNKRMCLKPYGSLSEHDSYTLWHRDTMTVIDWHEQAREYKKQYENDDGIHEYIDGMLPVYFGDINQVYHDEIGTPLNIEIEAHHVGLEFWRIMIGHIFEAYLENFLTAWHELEEE